MAASLKKLRQRLQISQRELANLTGVQQTTISALERGAISDPRVSTVRKLARALGHPPVVVIRAIERSVEEASA